MLLHGSTTEPIPVPRSPTINLLPPRTVPSRAGDPNGEGLPAWEPYDLATEPYLDFGEDVQLSNGLLKEQLDFFERLQESKYGVN